MQPPPAGPASSLPHTQARPVHWIVTAAALAAVFGAAALLQPADATATTDTDADADAATGHGPDAGPQTAPQAAPPRAADAEYPLDCGPYGVVVTDEAATDLDADGRPETVAAVRCDAAGGTPPSGLYLLAAPAEPGAAPRVAETLLDPAEQMTVDSLQAADGRISASLLGYSSPDVPRAQPDLAGEASWTWEDGRLRLHAETPLPGLSA